MGRAGVFALMGEAAVLAGSAVWIPFSSRGGVVEYLVRKVANIHGGHTPIAGCYHTGQRASAVFISSIFQRRIR
jgi:hypothetical protein